MLIEQWRTEPIVTQWATELGAEIRRGHELTQIAQRPEGVEVLVRGPDGDYTATGQYLVGADGGRSTVRKLVDVEFSGTDSNMEALVSDVAGLQDLPRGLHRFERGDMAVFQLEDEMTRIMAFVHGTGPRRRQEPPTFAELVANVHLISGYTIDHGKPSWISSFGNAARQAAHYRRWRVFLAGDAAHVHSPYGGQGLNLIRMKPDRPALDAAAVRSFAAGRLAHFKIPRYVIVVDEFPMTVTGKVRKVEMREITMRRLGLD
jgi:bifunctional hydroxylase/dehydrase